MATEPEVLVVTELEAAVLVDFAALVDAAGVLVEELTDVFVRLVGAELAAAVVLPAALLVPVELVAATAVLGTRAKARTPEAATAPSAPTVVAARTLRWARSRAPAVPRWNARVEGGPEGEVMFMSLRCLASL